MNEVGSHPTTDPNLLKQLEDITSKAREGKVVGFVCIWTEVGDREPRFAHSYVSTQRLKMIGALEVLKIDLCNHYELASTNETS